MRDIVLFVEVPRSGIRATYYQAARSLGLLPVLVTASRFGDRRPAASEDLRVPRLELAAVLSAVDRIGRDRIAGVFADGDSAVELAARAAAALGRPHADPETIRLCNDKYRLREFLAHKGLNTVAYRHVATAAEALDAAERLGGTVVVKPLTSSGSDGVRICRTSREAALHATRLLKRRTEGVLIEAYIDAPQFAVDLFDGKALNVKQSYATPGPFPIMTGHDTPPSLPDERLEEIKSYASAMVREVGIARGPSAVQLRDDGAEKYIVEINPRSSLNAPVETKVTTGIDAAALCLRFACGIPYASELVVRRTNRACATRFVVRHGSSVRAIEGVEEARKVRGIRDVYVNESLFYRRGPATGGRDRIVHLHAEAETVEEATANAAAAIGKLTIVYDRFPIDWIKSRARRLLRLRAKLFHDRSLKAAQSR